MQDWRGPNEDYGPVGQAVRYLVARADVVDNSPAAPG